MKRKLKRLIKAVISADCTEFVWEGLTYRNKGGVISVLIEKVDGNKTSKIVVGKYPYKDIKGRNRRARFVASGVMKDLYGK